MEDLNLIFALIAMCIVACVIRFFMDRASRRRTEKLDAELASIKEASRQRDADFEQLQHLHSCIQELGDKVLQARYENNNERADALEREREELTAIYESLEASFHRDNDEIRARLAQLKKHNG